VQRVLAAASGHTLRPGRAVLHALPTGYTLDAQANIVEPRGMIGERLGVDLHVVTPRLRRRAISCSRSSAAISASRRWSRRPTPPAFRRSPTTRPRWARRRRHGRRHDDVAVFAEGRLVHADAFAVGGHHVTMDIARGLTTTGRRCRAPQDAVRRGAVAASVDDRDMIASTGRRRRARRSA
jgi:cell division protein FtsA